MVNTKFPLHPEASTTNQELGYFPKEQVEYYP